MAHVITVDDVKKSLKLKYGHAIYPDGARKIKAGHIIDMDAAGAKVAKKVYSGEVWGGYTGNFTTSEVTIDGVPHILYALTSAGTLTLKDTAKVWMNGGGASGGYGSSRNSATNTGGGGGYVLTLDVPAGSYPVLIGSGGPTATSGNGNDGGTTSIGEIGSAQGGKKGTSDGRGGDGASGGGGRANSNGNYAGGSGAGVSTYPFGLTELSAHSAGGAAGTTDDNVSYSYRGGAGGTNGGNGGTGSKYGSFADKYQANGGSKGGGKGGNQNNDQREGGAATFYGSAGGGGGFYGAGGAGYQGIVYVAIPA